MSISKFIRNNCCDALGERSNIIQKVEEIFSPMPVNKAGEIMYHGWVPVRVYYACSTDMNTNKLLKEPMYFVCDVTNEYFYWITESELNDGSS